MNLAALIIVGILMSYMALLAMSHHLEAPEPESNQESDDVN